MYYLHVEKLKVANQDGIEQTMDVDAGLYPTKFNSKMFLSYCERKPEQIYSGDIVRLLHIESNCYM